MMDRELHGVEDAVGYATFRVLIGFWLGVVILAAGFWSALEIAFIRL
tara:strand:+ start:13726 stop:13866 length:141 start_codon:yes stop_codon:yes gene_type:complete